MFIMEAGTKIVPNVASVIMVQWKSTSRGYNDTKPNIEHIHTIVLQKSTIHRINGLQKQFSVAMKDDTDEEPDEQELEAHYMYMAKNSRAQDDQDETDYLDQERDLLASLIQKLKCEIDDSKNQTKFLESSNKELVDKLKVQDYSVDVLKTLKVRKRNMISKYEYYASKWRIDCATSKGDY
ncbi:hypothetical protein Tco_0840072 [Tanacetum coccineum]|uniref:Uncharacterized protein n=1 Tax=Tanacetum coccineum TaxID=301880 RepID=A0ABQ5AT38_9ASTR